MRGDSLASAVVVLHQTPARFTAAPMGVSAGALRRILRTLLNRGFRFVGLEEVGPAGPPAGAIALTADDGYASQDAHLRPLLLELGLPWTVFVLAGLFGKWNDWDRPWISPRERHITEEDVRRLAGEGVSIGSHGLNHANMTTLSDAALDEEMARSREILQSLSGQKVDAVAFPWGLADVRSAASARRAGYRLGFGVAAGRGGRTADGPAASRLDLLPRVGLYAPDQIFPGFAAAGIGASPRIRSLRGGLERIGQGLAAAAQGWRHA